MSDPVVLERKSNENPEKWRKARLVINPAVRKASFFSPRFADARLSRADQAEYDKRLKKPVIDIAGPLQAKYLEITRYYQAFNENNKTHTWGGWFTHLGRYLWRGHIYKGVDWADRPFVELIHHVSLLSPEYTKNIAAFLEENALSRENQKKLLNRFYNIFREVQENLHQNDAAWLAQERKSIAEHYAVIINENFEYNKIKLSVRFQKRLEHDIRLLRKQVDAREESRVNQLKLLKQKIHHFSQELGFGKRIKNIKKDNENALMTYVLQENDFDISDKQKSDRNVKQQNKVFAKWMAVIVSVTDTCVGLMGILALGITAPYILIPVLIVVGAGGFISNIFFMRGETEEMLTKLRLNFKKTFNVPKDGSFKEWFKFIGTLVFGACAFVAGGYMGVFALVETIEFCSLFLGASAALGVSIFPAFIAFLALSFILFTVVSDFFQEERWNNIKDYFFDTLGVIRYGGWLCVPVFIFELSKLLLGLAVCVLVTVLTCGFGYHHGLALMGKTTQAGKASIALSSVNGVASLFFGADEGFTILSYVTLPNVLKALSFVVLTALIVVPPVGLGLHYFVGLKNCYKNMSAFIDRLNIFDGFFHHQTQPVAPDEKNIEMQEKPGLRKFVDQAENVKSVAKAASLAGDGLGEISCLLYDDSTVKTAAMLSSAVSNTGLSMSAQKCTTLMAASSALFFASTRGSKVYDSTQAGRIESPSMTHA